MPDLENLPKWGQTKIMSLTDRVQTLERELGIVKTGKDDAKIIEVRSGVMFRPITTKTIQFRLDDGAIINVTHRGDKIELKRSDRCGSIGIRVRAGAMDQFIIGGE